MTLVTVTAVALTAILLAPCAWAAQGDFDLTGYVRAFATYAKVPGTDRNVALMETRIRLKVAGEATERLHMELAYELAPIWKDNADLPTQANLYQGFSYRAYDLDPTLYPDPPAMDDKLIIVQNLDRAFATYSRPSFDLHIGRQPVAFGSARVINPTDVLAPYPFDTLAKEERVGVDALRLKIPMGSMSELDGGTVFGDEFQTEQSAAFLRFKGYAMETDFSIMVMRFKENDLMGLDVSRAIGGAGTWLEAAQIFTNTPGNDYFSLSVGAEYIFTDKFYGFLEYHFNGAGTTDKSLYITNAMQEAYTDGGVYLMGRNYLAPGLSYQFTPLVTFTMICLVNLDDSSALIAPDLQYNITQDLYLGLGGYAGLAGEADASGQEPEFAAYPGFWYASASYYF